MKFPLKINGLAMLLVPLVSMAAKLPADFVYLRNIAPSIIQEIRYYGNHNFIGRRIGGYEAPECILTKQAAQALVRVQRELQKSHLSLKVYDCYRPQRAVNDFLSWSKESKHKQMKGEFYPREKKSELFEREYIADRSGHTRGSTVDLTIVNLPPRKQPVFEPGQKLVPCYYPYKQRFADNSLDFGTGFDCLDVKSHWKTTGLSPAAKKNRRILLKIMEKNGFEKFKNEWWHFTLQNEPHKYRYFDFPVQF